MLFKVKYAYIYQMKGVNFNKIFYNSDGDLECESDYLDEVNQRANGRINHNYKFIEKNIMDDAINKKLPTKQKVAQMENKFIRSYKGSESLSTGCHNVQANNGDKLMYPKDNCSLLMIDNCSNKINSTRNTSQQKIKIYRLASYQETNYDINRYRNYDIAELCKELESDNNYHFLIHPKVNYIFFGSLDGYKSSFQNFASKLLIFLDDYYSVDIDINDIKYTANSASRCSYHYSIPKLYCSCEKLYEIHSNLELVYTELKYNNEKGQIVKCIDTTIYNEKMYKAPNQSKDNNDQEKHKIVIGKMLDFVIEYIPEYSNCIEDVQFIDKFGNLNNNNIQNKVTEDQFKQKITTTTTMIYPKNKSITEQQKEIDSESKIKHKFKSLVINLFDECYAQKRFDDNNELISTGTAIMTELQEDGFELFNYYLSKSLKHYSTKQAKQKYNSFKKSNYFNLDTIITNALIDNKKRCSEILKIHKVELKNNSDKKNTINENTNEISTNDNDLIIFKQLITSQDSAAKLFCKEYINRIFITDNKYEPYIYDEITALWVQKDKKHYTFIIGIFLEKMINIERERLSTKENSNYYQKELDRFELKMGNISFKKGVWEHCCTIFYESQFLKRLDSIDYLLPIQNKQVVDLRTGMCEDRKLEHYFTFECSVNMLEGETPNADKFFAQVMNNNLEAIKYFQKCMGYCITGETKSKCSFIFWGYDFYSKETVIDLLKTILQKFYSIVSKNAFKKQKHQLYISGKPTPHLMTLIGTRICVQDEINIFDELSINLIETLTSNNDIIVRQLNKGEQSFKSHCKLLIQTNERSKFNYSNTTLKYIPFIADKRAFKADTEFIDQLKTTYLSEVFTWLVRGAMEWYNDPTFNPPKSIENATSDYINEMDLVEQFISEKCIVKSGLRILRSHFYRAYMEWCDDNYGIKIYNKSDFFKRMDKMDKIRKVFINGNYLYQGISLITYEEVKNRVESTKQYQFIDDSDDDYNTVKLRPITDYVEK